MNHDELIERLLCGELSPDDPAARALLESSPEARRELEELRVLEHGLAGAGRDRDAILREAERGPVPGESAVVEQFRDLMAASGAARGDGWRLLAAAAVWFALILGAIQFGSRPTRPHRDDTLGEGARVLTPHAEIDAYDLFEWESDILWPNGSVDLIFYDAHSGAILHEERDLDGTHWRYDSALAFPDAIEWELIVRDGAGFETGQLYRVHTSLR